MELDLFDFDFTEANNDMLSDERISEQFKELQKMFKQNRNAYFMGLSELPRDMMVYIDEFENKGWIERRGNNGINIYDEYLDYHTVDEVVSNFKNMMEMIMKKPDVNWYNDVVSIANHGATPIRYKNEEVKALMHKKEREITIQAAMKFGLKHFIEVPSARGTKMNPFSSKWARDNVLPLITDLIIPITEYEEMEKFFKDHVFFFGRRDWDRDGYRSDYDIPPYPEYRRLLPSYLETASLCETTDEQTIKLILDYAGSAFGYSEQRDHTLTFLYPKGWSKEKYESSLTDEDRELIEKDQERLRRLHSPSV